jgi:hypothetical protein
MTYLNYGHVGHFANRCPTDVTGQLQVKRQFKLQTVMKVLPQPSP